MLDVTAMLRPERQALVDLLDDLAPEQWDLPTECPAYSVHGIATHLLGDDLSLLSRQRDAAPSGLFAIAEELPGVDFRTLLDTFNDRWVAGARFLSPRLLIDLLRYAGEETAAYYGSVDLYSPGEPVGFFGGFGGPSPMWQAVAREYVERWVHQSQIRRAIGLPSLADEAFVRAGLDVVAAAGGVAPGRDGDLWTIGPVVLGDRQQAADLLTRGHTAEEVRQLVRGPADAVDLLAAAMGR
jgi:uncharacterized protein (TIGR03083 family)